MRRIAVGTLLVVGLLFGYGGLTPTPPPSFDMDSGFLFEDNSGIRPDATQWFSPTLSAQAGDFRGFHRTFTTQTAVGATASSGQMRGIAVHHTTELIVTGAPTGCTYRLQGTRDGTTWFNLSAADVTCTTTAVAFEANKPAVQVRGNLLTLTGGTTPSVTLKYIGR